MYPHFTVKSDFSFMEGASKVKAIVAKAKKEGITSLALTDRGNMYGAFEFSKIAKSEGIMPIIGVQLPFKIAKGKYAQIVLLAMSDVGYMNICHLMSDALSIQENGQEKGYLDSDLMKGDCNEGIIVLSGADDGLPMTALRTGDVDLAKRGIKWFAEAFPGRFYLQVNRNLGLRDVEDIQHEKTLLAIAADPKLRTKSADGSRDVPVPLIATSEVRYATKDRHDSYELLQAMKGQYKIDVQGDDLARKDEKEYALLSSAEMEMLFADIPHALTNAQLLAQRCSFMVEARKPILPAFPTEGGRSEDEELRDQSFKGLEERLKDRSLSNDEKDRYIQRLEYELGIIESMGFPGYFLIVSDFIKWSKEQDIPVGPGRGSGAGSLVAWSLMITDLDPFQFGLLFERFLNPERVSMPDFDIDFCQDRREEVIAYVKEKYGSDSVSQIGTFGEVKSKLALKNVGRWLVHPQLGGFGFSDTDGVTKLIPNKEGSAEPCGIKEAYEVSEEFRERIDESSKMQMLFEYSQKVEGLYDKVGSHAAGILIGDRPLDQLLPVRWDDKTGNAVSQFNMKASESVGLVKFDFLGLKTLSVIKEAVEHIKAFRGETVDIDRIPNDDQDVFEMLAKGQSNGVFQFESAGMQNVLRQVKPTRLEDLIAVNALFRPGPMDQIPHYAACKNGQEKPYYPNPVERTKPFLEETFGIMVYQEQVMMVAQEVAGYSLGGADLLRRAMGKKIPEEMDAQRKIFVEGATKKGAPEKEANDLFDTIAKFAGYGFNKSHAAAYAWIGYQTAWLKYHYPAEFFSALMSYEDKPERMALIKDDMATFGVEMLPPDVRRSYARFRPEASQGSTGGLGIRLGLTAIKGISGDMIDFVKERENRPFEDLKDFSVRGGVYFDKSKIEKLAEAGAFDSFDENRLRAMSLVNWHMKNAKIVSKKQTSFFDDQMFEDPVPEDIMEVQDWGNRLDREFNAAGFYFNKHPIDHYMHKLRHKGVLELSEYRERMAKANMAQMDDCKLCVMVEFARDRYSQRGNYFLTMKLGEKTTQYDAVCFGNSDMSVAEVLEAAKLANANRTPVIVKCKLASEDAEGKMSVYVNEIISIDEFLEDVRGDVEISVDVNEIQDLPETTRKKIQIEDDLSSGKITEETAKNQLAAERKKLVSSRLQALNKYIAGLKTKEGETGVQIGIMLMDQGRIMEKTTLVGSFNVTPAHESRIKAFDGVVGISEVVGKLKPHEPKMKAPKHPGDDGDVIARRVRPRARVRPRTRRNAS